MQLNESERSKSFFDHGQNPLGFQNHGLFFPGTVRSFEIKFHMKAYGRMCMSTDINELDINELGQLPPFPYMVKTLKNFFSRTE